MAMLELLQWMLLQRQAPRMDQQLAVSHLEGCTIRQLQSESKGKQFQRPWMSDLDSSG